MFLVLCSLDAGYHAVRVRAHAFIFMRMCSRLHSPRSSKRAYVLSWACIMSCHRHRLCSYAARLPNTIHMSGFCTGEAPEQDAAAGSWQQLAGPWASSTNGGAGGNTGAAASLTPNPAPPTVSPFSPSGDVWHQRGSRHAGVLALDRRQQAGSPLRMSLTAHLCDGAAHGSHLTNTNVCSV